MTALFSQYALRIFPVGRISANYLLPTAKKAAPAKSGALLSI
ncbi:hypothetical protein [Dyadobacter sediminis]|nr:hypothetical protein [Dyadobacter sediminis]